MKWSLGLLLIPVLFGACGTGAPPSAGMWSEWSAVPNAYAKDFKVWKHGDERLVVVFGHGGEQDTVGKYWLTKEQSEHALPIHAERISLPLQRVAMMSTTHVPFASTLGKADVIVAAAHLDQVRDHELLDRIGSGAVKEIAMGDGVDREKLLALKLDALFTYPFGQSGAGSVKQLGIPVIEVSEYLEEYPLGRAEWLRFFGMLFGEEHRADSLFAGIRERYESMRVQITDSLRPTVLFGSVWQGQWWVPPGNSYMARLIEDAGGKYLFSDRKGTGNIAVDMETMIATASNADAWGMIADIPTFPTRRDFTNDDPRLMEFKSVKSYHLFCGNTHEADLFGQAVLEPDILLKDLGACISEKRLPEWFKERRPYFHPVPPEQAVLPDEITAPGSP